MSKIRLYTVQGKESKGKKSVADTSGLTAYLGYRPVFCTKIDSESLAESWFRIWAASPNAPETIRIFEVEESDCVPMNVVDWSNKCLNRECDNNVIASVLNDKMPQMTDYLVKEIPNEGIEIPVGLLYQSTVVFERLLNIPLNEKQSILNIFKAAQKACRRVLESSIGTDGSRIDKTSYDAIYGAMRLTGIIPFLWQVAACRGINDVIFSIMPENFNVTSLMKAQELIQKWDNSIGEEEFSYEDYDDMRNAFIDALNSAAKSVVEQAAKSKRIGRNDKCPCGSGKKFKHCHASADLDSIVNNPF